MSDQLQLGKVNPSGGRDAFHVAVIPVKIGEKYMRPGQRVKLKFGTNDTIISADYRDAGPSIGIIDPFIDKYYVNENEVVYLWLNPGTVTGMQHCWKHPLFDNEPKKASEAELWLRNFAERWGFNYEEMISVAKSTHIDEYGDIGYITAHGHDLYSYQELGEDYYTFWEKIEELIGYKFDEEHRKKVHWSCSC